VIRRNDLLLQQDQRLRDSFCKCPVTREGEGGEGGGEGRGMVRSSSSDSVSHTSVTIVSQRIERAPAARRADTSPIIAQLASNWP